MWGGQLLSGGVVGSYRVSDGELLPEELAGADRVHVRELLRGRVIGVEPVRGGVVLPDSIGEGGVLGGIDVSSRKRE